MNSATLILSNNQKFTGQIYNYTGEEIHGRMLGRYWFLLIHY